jgi:hypothetical protein
MAYDEVLAERIRDILGKRGDTEEKKMFGGLCFMLSSHMCCGIVGDRLMARVGPEHYEDLLAKDHVKEMDFTGRSMKGYIYVNPPGIEDDSELAEWLKVCTDFVDSLPPKKPKKKK